MAVKAEVPREKGINCSSAEGGLKLQLESSSLDVRDCQGRCGITHVADLQKH